MYRKLFGVLFFLAIAKFTQASEFYTHQLAIPYKTPYLHFNIPQKNTGIMATGPADATVIDSTFVLLDSWGSGLVFFDNNGNFLTLISLPPNAQFERLVRDKDNTLFVLGAVHGSNSKKTMIVHIQNEVITEKAIHKITENLIDDVIPDDYGLFMEREEDHEKPTEASLQNGKHLADNALYKMDVYQDRINRNCISCSPKPAKGINVNGLLYRINPGVNQSLTIGKKIIPLVLDPQYKSNYSKIIQVDPNGTAWIENYVNNDKQPGITYVWKVNKKGSIIALYRLASDREETGTLWPMKHDIIINNDAVYSLTANNKQLNFVLLKPHSQAKMHNLAKKLDSTLAFKKKVEQKNPDEMLTTTASDELLITGVCQTRMKVLKNAIDYLNNTIFLSASSIKNDAKCPNRVVPPYLIATNEKEGSYSSVSYNWGGFDSIAEFNKKILTNKMKAGNVNDKNSPLLSCTAGIDCSGFISRVWGLTSKLGTYDLGSDKITEEISAGEMQKGDIFLIGGFHVMLYKSGNILGNSTVIEANAIYGNVVEKKYPLKWLIQTMKYKPRRPISSIICKD